MTACGVSPGGLCSAIVWPLRVGHCVLAVLTVLTILAVLASGASGGIWWWRRCGGVAGAIN